MPTYEHMTFEERVWRHIWTFTEFWAFEHSWVGTVDSQVRSFGGDVHEGKAQLVRFVPKHRPGHTSAAEASIVTH